MLKTIARKMVRKDHWHYMSWYRGDFGMLPAIGAYIKLLPNKRIARAPNPLTGGSVFLRPGTADQDAYHEIFIAREYELDLGDPRFIVDAGAHIGLASVFFASRYPDATILALEPEPANIDMLLMNTRGFPNIKPVCMGLWSGRAYLRIDDPNVANWSFRVSESPDGQGIPALGVQDLIADFGIPRIDVLKIDIEGSEVEVLNAHAAWIDAVGALIIELHDRFRLGCREALSEALARHQYEESSSGENVVIQNLRRLH